MIQQVKFAITTLADGSYSSTLLPLTAPQADVAMNAKGPFYLDAVEWALGTLDTGVDAVLSVTSTLSGVDLTLLTLTNAGANAMYYPRVIADGVTGADLTGWYVKHIVEGKLKLAVTNGGNVLAGTCIVYLTDQA